MQNPLVGQTPEKYPQKRRADTSGSNLVPRLFIYARRCGKDPGCSWSRDSLENPLLYRVGKVSNYILPHTSDTFQMQGVRFNCYERQYKLFDLKLSIFVYFVCFISFIIVNV